MDDITNSRSPDPASNNLIARGLRLIVRELRRFARCYLPSLELPPRHIIKLHDRLAYLYPAFYLLWIYFIGASVYYLQDYLRAVAYLSSRPTEFFLFEAKFPTALVIAYSLFAPLTLFTIPMLVRFCLRLIISERPETAHYDRMPLLRLSPPRLLRRLVKGRYERSDLTGDLLRGAKVNLFHEAVEKGKKLTRELAGKCAFFNWGTLPIPIDRHLSHFALLGMSRSGKTTVIRLLMQDILSPTLQRKAIFPPGRAIIFDPKSEFYPLLIGMGIEGDAIAILNPFDERCSPWDIAADVRNETDATTIAELLVETNDGAKEGSAHFYKTAARNVIAGLLWAMHKEFGDQWTFRDFLLTLDRIENVMAFLHKRPETARYIRDYDANPETFGNLRSQLRNVVIDYHAIASCWHNATQPSISINRWMQSSSHKDDGTPSILLLGYDASKPVQFSVLNRALIYKVSQSILASGGTAHANQDRTWMFLDEATLLAKLPILTELLNTGASRGCCVVIGFQTIQGMERVFGENEAGELIGQCGNLAIFRIGNNPQTAEWAANALGKAEYQEWNESVKQGAPMSKTHSSATQERFAVRPETLQSIPQINPVNGLHGYFISERYGLVDSSMAKVSGPELWQQLKSPAAGVAAFCPRSHDQLTLRPWSEKEESRFVFLKAGDPPTQAPKPGESTEGPTPPPATNSFLDGIPRFETSSAAPRADQPQRHRTKTVAETYAEFCAQQDEAIRKRASVIQAAYATKLQESQAKHGVGSRRRYTIVLLKTEGVAQPISVRSNPLEHAARRSAAKLTATWCEANGMLVTVKTVPGGANPPPSIIEQIVLEVLI